MHVSALLQSKLLTEAFGVGTSAAPDRSRRDDRACAVQCSWRWVWARPPHLESPHPALRPSVTELRELELLDFDESYRGGTYRLAVPLLAEWLKMNVDFDDLVVRAREEAMEARW